MPVHDVAVIAKNKSNTKAIDVIFFEVFIAMILNH
jgi:hypothetical protein